MASSKCAAAWCSNESGSGLSFHRFPPDRKYADQWIEYANCPRLKDLPPKQLERVRLCGLHFTPFMYLPPGPTSQRILKRLKKNAVPTVPVYDPELRPFVPPKFYKGPLEEDGAPLPPPSTLPYTIPLSSLPPLSSLSFDAPSHTDALSSPAVPPGLASPPSPAAPLSPAAPPSPPSSTPPASPVAFPSDTAPLSPSITSSPVAPSTEKTEDVTDPSQVLSQQQPTEPGENGEHQAQLSWFSPMLYGYYDHAYSKNESSRRTSEITPQQPKPPPKRRGRPPLYKKVQEFTYVDSDSSNDQITTPPPFEEDEQLSSRLEALKEQLLHNKKRRLQRHYWMGRSHLLRTTSRYHRPRSAILTRERIASEAAKYVSKEFLDILRAELRLPPLKRVKDNQPSCSSNPSTAEDQGGCKEISKSPSLHPESLDDPYIFLSSTDGTNATTQVSCWQISVPLAVQGEAEVVCTVPCENTSL